MAFWPFFLGGEGDEQERDLIAVVAVSCWVFLPEDLVVVPGSSSSPVAFASLTDGLTGGLEA